MANTRAVTVLAPARLHMGFVDLNGGLGRNFGGIGLALEGLHTQVTVSRASRMIADGPGAERAKVLARAILDSMGELGDLHISIDRAIPEHAGLGSGTQLSLALSAAIARLYDHDMPVSDLALLTGRGLRSGIGIGTFRSGGFIVDGGRGPNTVVPPVLVQAPFPHGWRVLLLMDERIQGLSGSAEHEAFEDMEAMSADRCGELCRILLMQVLPALVEEQFEPFALGISAIQNAVGDYFARYQSGMYSSERVGNVMEFLRIEGAPGLGQSSWGPTGFALAESNEQAEAMRAAIHSEFGELSGVRCLIVAGRNRGSEMRIEASRGAASSAAGR
jgi:beta-ribofuranosylaminobenzene 5'-phosphate synthase